MGDIGVENADAEIAAIIESNKHEASKGNTSQFFSARHSKIIWLAFLIAFLISFPALILFYIMPRKF